MSYFLHGDSARRYARHRPYFHPLVIEKIGERLALDVPLARVLDVACGTGQSSHALLPLTDTVIGVDVSGEMLHQIDPRPQIVLARSRAEQLPFAGETFPLATVALAIHWFDRDAFLADIARVLQPNGYLVVYTNGFSGIMQGNPAFTDWSHGTYREKYPTPPRDRRPITPEEMAVHGFTTLHEETYRNEVHFSRSDLAHYLMTQSNIIAALQGGTGSADAIFDWLVDSLKPYFEADTGIFLFGGSIAYYQKL